MRNSNLESGTITWGRSISLAEFLAEMEKKGGERFRKLSNKEV